MTVLALKFEMGIVGSLLEKLLEFAKMLDSGAKFEFGENIDLSKGPKKEKKLWQ